MIQVSLGQLSQENRAAACISQICKSLEARLKHSTALDCSVLPLDFYPYVDSFEMTMINVLC